MSVEVTLWEDRDGKLYLFRGGNVDYVVLAGFEHAKPGTFAQDAAELAAEPEGWFELDSDGQVHPSSTEAIWPIRYAYPRGWTVRAVQDWRTIILPEHGGTARPVAAWRDGEVLMLNDPPRDRARRYLGLPLDPDDLGDEFDLQRIALACARECERQGVGVDGLALLTGAYLYAWERRDAEPTQHDMEILAGLIQPDPNDRGFRQTAITAGDDRGTDWREIPGAVERLWQQLTERPRKSVMGHHVRDPVDQFIAALLRIHPYEDGNGRLAFVLRNWLLGALGQPEPLPDYFQ